MSQPHQHIINIDALEQQPFPAPLPDTLKDTYEGATMGFITKSIGLEQLGCNVTILPPGKRTFPFHRHISNEELFVVLEGTGEVRLGDDRVEIRTGDVIGCPAKGPAHQIINTSDKPLRYLAVSTSKAPEVAEYPDSNKFGVLTGDFRFLGRKEDSLEYWDGE